MDQNLVDFHNNSDFIQEQNIRHFEIPKWTRTLQLVFMVLLCGIGLLGNGLVVIIQKRLRDKSSTDYLVLTMALLDLFCSTCVTPIYMAQNIQSVWNLILSGTFCKLKYFVIYGTNISSTILFSALAFDRYMRTCHPLSSLYTCSKTKTLCVIIVLVSFSMAASSFHVIDQSEAHNDCIQVESARIMGIIMNSCLTGAFVLLFGMVVFCYIKITLKIRERAKIRTQRNIESLKINRSSSRNFRLSKSKRVAPMPLYNGTNSSGKCNDFESKTLSSKDPVHNSSGSCSADSANDAIKTGNDVMTFANQIDRQVQNTSAYMTLTASALKDFTSGENKISSSLYNSYLCSKRQRLKENVHCSKFACENNYGRNLSKSTQKPCDFSHHHNKKHQNSLQPKLKQQEHIQKLEESNVVSQREKKEIQKVNYVTLMMFIITATYVTTWVSAWLLYAIFRQTTFTGNIVLYLTRTSFAVNYIANPIFFTLMCAKFRERARNLICCRK